MKLTGQFAELTGVRVAGAARLALAVAMVVGGTAAVSAQGVQSASLEWEQRFDSAPATARMPRTSTPILSPQTIQATEMALEQYVRIEAQGGWPAVPQGPALKLGARHPNVVALRERLVVSGDLPATAGRSDAYDSYVEAAVRRFQARHGINQTGVVAEATYAALNVPASVRRQQLETNIVRLRSMGSDPQGRFVMVNIPAASIEAVKDGQVELRHTAVVGKVDRQSPVLSVTLREVNFNPFWTVPASIIRKDLIPKMQKEPDYLTKNKIRIFAPGGEELQPEQVNWNSDEAMRYRFTQDPGELNSMGSMRLNMPNSEGVYMHDTPSKGLFGENARFHSSGCVRVQNVRELADWLLKETPGWDRPQIDAAIRSGDRIDARIAQPVAVHWVYVTGWADSDGVVQFRDDIYNHDGLGQLALR